MRYHGYEIAASGRRGGKAGRGKNISATIQVREPLSSPGACLLKKQFRYTVADSRSRKQAIVKALAWVDTHPSIYIR
jgi:hypothetical protein